MLIPSYLKESRTTLTSLSRRVNANSQLYYIYQANGLTSLSRRVNANSQLHRRDGQLHDKLIKKGEC